EKLEKHSFSDDDYGEIEIKISPCEIFIKRRRSIQEFNPSDSEWESEGLVFEDRNLYRVKAKAGQVIKLTNFTTPYGEYILLYGKGVPDISDRFAKALNHLATFCEKP